MNNIFLKKFFISSYKMPPRNCAIISHEVNYYALIIWPYILCPWNMVLLSQNVQTELLRKAAKQNSLPNPTRRKLFR